MSIHYVVKLNFSRLSVCLHYALTKWRHMTSHKVIVIDVICVYFSIKVALNHNRNAVFNWSVDMCFIFIKQLNVIFMRRLYEAVILCHCIIVI